MLKKLIFFLLLFILPLLAVDYYIQQIASPMQFQAAQAGTQPTPKKVQQQKKQKEEVKETPKSQPDTTAQPIGCQLKHSTIYFKDYAAKEHEIAFSLCDSILEKSVQHRRTLRSNKPHQKLVNFDASLITNIVATYKKKIQEQQLGYKAGAEYVVASIQNIPYTLVHGPSHKAAEDPATYIKKGVSRRQAKKIAQLIKKQHEQKKEMIPLDQIGGCLEEVVHYGVVSPLELFLNQMGDCDSRATALYLVLKKLGYDVLELGSDAEGHALLAINLPSADGNVYYKYRGKKYYVWETTFFDTKQSRVGLHPNGIRYMKNWHLWEVALN